MLCCHCDGAYTAPTPMSSVYQTCCQRQLIGRLSLYDADCELTCHARSSRSFGALSLARFHAPRLHWFRSPQCDPKAYGLDILRRLRWRDSVHFVCIGTDPFSVARSLMEDGITPRNYACPQSSCARNIRCELPGLMGGCDLTSQQEEIG